MIKVIVIKFDFITLVDSCIEFYQPLKAFNLAPNFFIIFIRLQHFIKEAVSNFLPLDLRGVSLLEEESPAQRLHLFWNWTALLFTMVSLFLSSLSMK